MGGVAPSEGIGPERGRPSVDDDSHLDRILTVPNLITAIRLALLPVFVWLVVGRDDLVAGAVLLALLGATDWVDGWIARRWNQITTIGKVIDPVADRLLFFVSIATIIAADAAPLWFCIAVLVREVGVAVATLVLAALGARRIDVTWYGKAGTFGLMFAFPLFMLGASHWSGRSAATVAAWCFGLPGLLASYWAAIGYVPLGLAALREGRSGGPGERSGTMG